MSLIALTMRVTQANGYDEPRDAISHDWMAWLAQSAHVGLPVPNTLAEPAAYLEALAPAAVILTGGNDVEPLPAAPDSTSPERDRTEKAVLDWAIERSCPVFAVCRGLHFVNAYFGGGLDADLRRGPVQHVNHDHPVRLEGPFVDLAGRPTIETNSFHNQGVHLNSLAPALTLVAISEPDEIVEGLVHPDLPIVAVQWHPERPNPAANLDRLLLERLLAKGACWGIRA